MSAERERLALAALAMMVNDYGHTTTCWDDMQAAKDIPGLGNNCMSEACAITRRVLGLEGIRDSDTVRAILNRAQEARR